MEWFPLVLGFLQITGPEEASLTLIAHLIVSIPIKPLPPWSVGTMAAAHTMHINMTGKQWRKVGNVPFMLA